MAENINFISAAELPEATGEEVSVLCLENGEMKQKPGASLGGGGFMEVEITLSGNDFFSGTLTFNKTYNEIKDAMEKGYFVMGWAKNQQFTGQEYQYYYGFLKQMSPKYAADINGGTIFFISANNNDSYSYYIRADGTTGILFAD